MKGSAHLGQPGLCGLSSFLGMEVELVGSSSKDMNPKSFSRDLKTCFHCDDSSVPLEGVSAPIISVV